MHTRPEGIMLKNLLIIPFSYSHDLQLLCRAKSTECTHCLSQGGARSAEYTHCASQGGARSAHTV